MIELSKGLQVKGIQSTTCHFDAHPFNFQPDICLHLNKYRAPAREAKINKFFKKSIQMYDIFHFHFGETFFPHKKDLNILARAGKKMVVHHHGSDVRLLSIAKKNNPYVKVKPEWTEEKIKNNLSILSKYIDHAIVQDYELEGYISNFYKHVHVIPHALNVHAFKPQYPPMNDALPRVVHAPTKRNLKGTEAILTAVNKLKKDGLSFEFTLIEGKDHEETIKFLATADIVIDQLRIGSYGYTSSEAMALGKPVICYIREDLKEKYPKELPIVYADPHTITKVLRNLLNNPEKLRNIGMLGRAYVQKYHDTDKIVNKYIDIYKKL